MAGHTLRCIAYVRPSWMRRCGRRTIVRDAPRRGRCASFLRADNCRCILSNGNIDPDVARCVNARKHLGFVVESALPPALINKKIDTSSDSSSAECPIYKKWDAGLTPTPFVFIR